MSCTRTSRDTWPPFTTDTGGCIFHLKAPATQHKEGPWQTCHALASRSLHTAGSTLNLSGCCSSAVSGSLISLLQHKLLGGGQWQPFVGRVGAPQCAQCQPCRSLVQLGRLFANHIFLSTRCCRAVDVEWRGRIMPWISSGGARSFGGGWVPVWADLTNFDDVEPGTRPGWQQVSSMLLEERFVSDSLWPRLTPQRRALFRSQRGPMASVPYSCFPIAPHTLSLSRCGSSAVSGSLPTAHNCRCGRLATSHDSGGTSAPKILVRHSCTEAVWLVTNSRTCSGGQEVACPGSHTVQEQQPSRLKILDCWDPLQQ